MAWVASTGDRHFKFGLLVNIRAWLGALFVVLFPVILLLLGILSGAVVAAGIVALFVQLIALPSLLIFIYSVRIIAREACISDSGIVVRTFIGARKSLAWEQIHEIEEFDIYMFAEKRPQLRLRDAARSVEVGFDGRMPGFDDLRALILERARGARLKGDVRGWWERNIIPR